MYSVLIKYKNGDFDLVKVRDAKHVIILFLKFREIRRDEIEKLVWRHIGD